MKKIFLLLVLFVAAFEVTAQSLPPGFFEKNGEVYFRFLLRDKAVINQIASVISVDKLQGEYVYAYANKKEWEEFSRLNLTTEIISHPGDAFVSTSANIDDVKAWDTYPTYEAYVTMMQQYAAAYPAVCTLIDAGSTPGGRKILFLRISKNIGVREPEPRVMLSSTMHGDETTGFVLLLRLIDYLLVNYGTNAEVTSIVDKNDIWINPNQNPDGTYRSGNSSVTGARRGNFNNIDLNRNFPDPAAGEHPDGNAWQPENIIMMNLTQQYPYHLSANFHGGVEVVNYPWDTWSRLSTDDNYFVWLSRNYADTVHVNAVAGYMTYLNNGITNGYAWYRVTGGKQDYFTYFRRGREVTIEISNTKLLSGSLLPAHWNYNYRSFINLLKSTNFGVSGVVTNSITGLPVKAKVTINNTIADNAEVFSDSVNGYYLRLLKPGVYNITFSADSFYTRTFGDIVVSNGGGPLINVALVPTNVIPVELSSFTSSVKEDEVMLNWQTATEKNNRGFFIQRKTIEDIDWTTIGFAAGHGTTLSAHSYSFTDKPSQSGKYQYRLEQTDFDGSTNQSNIVDVDYYPIYSFALLQNYPNPFNPFTNISFTLQSEARVNLTVYNQLGEQVSVLVNKQMNAGSYAVSFAGEGLGSGMYFYTLRVISPEGNQKSETRKMIIQK